MYNFFATIFAVIFFFLILHNIIISDNTFGDFIETPENWIFLLFVLSIVLPMFYVLGLLFPITAPIIFYWTYYLRKNHN